MSTEFLPYVDHLRDSEYQAIVLIHEMPDLGRPRLSREAVGEPQPSVSFAMRLAMHHAATLASQEPARLR